MQSIHKTGYRPTAGLKSVLALTAAFILTLVCTSRVAVRPRIVVRNKTKRDIEELRIRIDINGTRQVEEGLGLLRSGEIRVLTLPPPEVSPVMISARNRPLRLAQSYFPCTTGETIVIDIDEEEIIGTRYYGGGDGAIDSALAAAQE